MTVTTPLDKLVKFNPKRFLEFFEPFDSESKSKLHILNQSKFEIFFVVTLYDKSYVSVFPANGFLKPGEEANLLFTIRPFGHKLSTKEIISHDIILNFTIKSKLGVPNRFLNRVDSCLNYEKRFKPVFKFEKIEEDDIDVEAPGTSSSYIRNLEVSIDDIKNVSIDKINEAKMTQCKLNGQMASGNHQTSLEKGDCIDLITTIDMFNTLKTKLNDKKCKEVSGVNRYDIIKNTLSPKILDDSLDGVKNNNVIKCYHCQSPIIYASPRGRPYPPACSVCKVPFDAIQIRGPNNMAIQRDYLGLKPSFKSDASTSIDLTKVGQVLVRDLSVSSNPQQGMNGITKENVIQSLEIKRNYVNSITDQHAPMVDNHRCKSTDILNSERQKNADKERYKEKERKMLRQHKKILEREKMLENKLSEVRIKKVVSKERFRNKKPSKKTNISTRSIVYNGKRSVQSEEDDITVSHRGHDITSTAYNHTFENDSYPHKQHILELHNIYGKVQDQIYCILGAIKVQDYSKELLLCMAELSNYRRLIPFYVGVFTVSAILGFTMKMIN